MAYGVQKLQISCVVEDDKVGTDFLEEKITEFEDFVSKTCSGYKSAAFCSFDHTRWYNFPIFVIVCRFFRVWQNKAFTKKYRQNTFRKNLLHSKDKDYSGYGKLENENKQTKRRNNNIMSRNRANAHQVM